MTRIFIIMLMTAWPLAAQDCSDQADACKAGPKAMSPFVAASIGERLPPPAISGARREAVREPIPVRKVKPEPAAEPESSPEEPTPADMVPEGTESAPDPAPQASARKFGVTNPIWLVFIGAMLAGLYFYLGGEARPEKKE